MTDVSRRRRFNRMARAREAEVLGNANLRDEWLEELGRLFGKLSEWLELGEVEHEERRVERVEDHLGRYGVNEIVVFAAGTIATIAPAGRLVIGATGRVDFRGPADEVHLFRYSDSKDWFFSEPSLDRRVWTKIRLTEDSFWDVLEQIFGFSD